MGVILSAISRKANRFNVEARAHKVISKDKPVPAPRHAYAQEDLNKMMKEFPEELEKLQTKSPQLDDRLKQIFVTSEDTILDPGPQKKVSSNLPQNRHTPVEPEFGFYEPEKIPLGRLSLRQALKIITDHQHEPGKWDAQTVANKYNISIKLSENILQYYKAFEVYIPDQKNSKHTIPPTFTSLISEGKEKK